MSEKPFDVQDFMRTGGIVMPTLCKRHEYDLIVDQLKVPESGPWRSYYIVAQILMFQGMCADGRFQKRVGPDGGTEAMNIVLSEIGCGACWNGALYRLVVRLMKRGFDYASEVSLGKRVDEDWQRWIGTKPDVRVDGPALAQSLEAFGVLRRIRAGEKFTRESLLEQQAMVNCPHCQKILAIVDVGEPIGGTNPWTQLPDEYFPLLLSDGFTARLWKTEPRGAI